MAKTLLFTGFRSRHDLRFFEKRVSTSILCIHQWKKSVQQVQQCSNLQGFGTKKLRKYQRFGVQKWPKHYKTLLFTVFRAFHVFLKLQKPCKYQHFLQSTRQKCIIYSIFWLCFQKRWYLQCFVHLWSKKYLYLQHFLRFCIIPAKEVKTQKCCNL